MNVSTTAASDPFLSSSTSSSAGSGDSSPSTIASDFSALTAAIQSGNAAAAQQALAQLKEDSPTMAKAIQNARSNSPLGALGSAVESGNMTDAQQALADLQQAIKARQDRGDNDNGDADAGADADAASSGSSAIAPDGTGSIINASA